MLVMILNRLRAICARLFRVYNGCHISLRAQLGKDIHLEGSSIISAGTSLNRVSVGFGSYFSTECKFENTSIGRYVSIGPNVKTLTAGSHPTRNFVSTYPAFYRTQHIIGISYCSRDKFEEHRYANEETKRAILIENDVWIGAGAVIFEGVTIHNGAIIGAGALVTKDVPAYAIVGGVPAKVIRQRFLNEDIQFLQKLKWWDKGEDWIKENGDYFESIEKLKKSQETRDLEGI